MNIKNFLSRLAANTEAKELHNAVDDLTYKMEISSVHWRADRDVSDAFDRICALTKARAALSAAKGERDGCE